MPKAEQPLLFDCEQQLLVGILHPAQASLGVIIISGAPQYRIGSHRLFVRLARLLAAQGYPVLRFDYRGLGDSSGVRPEPEALTADIQSAIDAFHQQQPQLQQIMLLGLCDGATAALAACQQDPRIQRLVLLNPWLPDTQARSQAYLQHYYRSQLLSGQWWRKLLTGQIAIGSRLREYLKHWQQSQQSASAQPHPLSQALAGFHGKSLILLSERDITAQSFQQLLQQPAWQQASHNCCILPLHGADHTLSQRLHQQQFFDLLIEWIAS